MKYYLKALKNYAVFNGRATRSEFWYYTLFNFIFLVVASTIDNILGTTFEVAGQSMGYGYVYLAFSLAMLIPGLAVTVRRLHDVGKSGWFLFIALLPLIGSIWLLVLFCTDSKPGANEYGENPKESGSGAVGGEALDSHLTT